MGWISNSVRDHDSDGCHDAEEDDDDDNDAIPDTVDDCPRGWFNWSASTSTDHDTDGCADDGTRLAGRGHLRSDVRAVVSQL